MTTWLCLGDLFHRRIVEAFVKSFDGRSGAVGCSCRHFSPFQGDESATEHDDDGKCDDENDENHVAVEFATLFTVSNDLNVIDDLKGK